MEGDTTLQGEVTRYQRATMGIHILTHQLVSLKRKFNNTTWEVYNSGKRLAMADTYKHLEPHIMYGITAGGDITEDDIQHGRSQITDPWDQGLDYSNATCKWCLKRGHHTTQC
jgi:hypothetical protein